MTMTAFATIELIDDPRGFATLWMSRADKNNAFNAQMIRELILALDAVQSNPALRFLLVRGRGKHFSAGADLAWMQQAAELDYNTNLDDARELAELMYNLAKLKIPTLAVVQGAAFGGALGLISCCDMAIAAEDAQFCLSEVRIGLAPAVISPFVVQAIGERAARRYALTAERFSAQRAQQIGLVAEHYPVAELESQTALWVDNLLLNSPQAMRASKDLLREVGSGVLTPALRRYCESAIARIRTSAEGQEGLRAFLNKRSPGWQAQPEQGVSHEKDSHS
ncbi:gamma-carboxygeranoyl-CoA hydratase [Pseudomonas triticifolii]|uniref:Gamma-carboxygeranoyl-CoA hydratase n=1 Tax=Pseudomonas triticifolii TaxID=2762592 RepID=A0ABR7BB04_9PSED|nr:gamma-carboxygeranoyl-CoA hydratase [Pseudomonas triticifolii]MBC3953830.1 gamma-carboxygeranoyl-CoA hydratase [Pseudomonas triticifolii]